MLNVVLYFMSLCYEQSPHRQLYIETSTGCSCVQISLDPCPHDHHFFPLLDTVSLYGIKQSPLLLWDRLI